MIRYALLCEHDHEFESWFDNSGAYEKLQHKNLVECPRCGSTKIRKALMTPQIAVNRSSEREPNSKMVAKNDDATLQQLHQDVLQLARKVRQHMTKNADDVGDQFASEARKIHFEEVEPHNIYGKATKEEAESLLEEGIDFIPLPELPEDKN